MAARISYQLLGWGVLSVGLGALLCFGLQRPAFWHAFGLQALIWGAIDAAIALVGLWQQWRGNGASLTRLRTILWVNAGLDVLYILVALGIILWWAQGDSWRLGHGWGVLIQGSFLFIFDSWHGWQIQLQERKAHGIS